MHYLKIIISIICLGLALVINIKITNASLNPKDHKTIISNNNFSQDNNTRSFKVVLKGDSGENIDLYSDSYAMVIGVSDYRSGWKSLPGVKKDVEEVKKVLELQGFKVEVLLNPTRNDFTSSVESFISNHGFAANNRLLFYFAGHGYTLKTSDGRQMGYIIPVESPDPRSDELGFKKTAINMDLIQTYAKQIEAKHALFVFDSCFSGTLFNANRGIPPAITSKTTKPVRQFITAGDANQEVPDNSIFCKQFVEGLNGEADLDKDGFITGSELGSFLETQVTNYSNQAQTPRSGKINNPDLDKGDFVFISKKTEIDNTNTQASKNNNPSTNSISAAELTAIEREYWQAVDKTKVEELKAYLAKYPNGLYEDLARAKIKSLDTTNTTTNNAKTETKTRNEDTKSSETIKSPKDLVEDATKDLTKNAAKAKVYIYRPAKFLGKALEPEVKCNKVVLANSDNGAYFVVSLDPGDYTFQCSDKKTSLNIKVQSNEKYYVKVDMIEGGLTFVGIAYGKLVLVEKSEAETEIQALKPLDLAKIKDTKRVSVDK